jgi:hypothetical protein
MDAMRIVTLEAKKMRAANWVLSLTAILLLASGAAAQEAARADGSAGETARSDRYHIRVLADPYDLAGFYRSSDGAGYGYGFFGYDNDGQLRATERYPIASYYRGAGRETYGYWRAQTWRTPPSTMRVRRTKAPARRSELYLFVPAFLAPVLPLAE